MEEFLREVPQDAEQYRRQGRTPLTYIAERSVPVGCQIVLRSLSSCSDDL